MPDFQLIYNHNSKISKQTKAKFSATRPAWFSCLPLFSLSVWRITIAPRGCIIWACRRLNSSYRKDQVKFECLLFDILKVYVTVGVMEMWNRLHNVLCSCVKTFSAILLKVSSMCLALRPRFTMTEKNCQDNSVTNINMLLARCWFPSAFLTHFIFYHPCLSSNCSSICEGCERTFLFPLQTTDCTPVECSKSIKTILFHWTTEVFLADC